MNDIYLSFDDELFAHIFWEKDFEPDEDELECGYVKAYRVA